MVEVLVILPVCRRYRFVNRSIPRQALGFLSFNILPLPSDTQFFPMFQQEAHGRLHIFIMVPIIDQFFIQPLTAYKAKLIIHMPFPQTTIIVPISCSKNYSNLKSCSNSRQSLPYFLRAHVSSAHAPTNNALFAILHSNDSTID